MKIKIIYTTTDSIKTANKIAQSLVMEYLSPCVQRIPRMNSVYRWENNIKTANEYLLIIKTKIENVQECKNIIQKYHNYNVPEIIVTNGYILNNKYNDWFLNSS